MCHVKGVNMSRMSLNQIEVAEPCDVSWDQMAGNGAGRFCEHCRKTVHDLSAMSKDQAERLVCESGGNLCVRFARAADGEMLTLDYRSAPAKRGWTWRMWTVIALAGGLTAGVVNAAIFGKRVMPAAAAQTQPPRMMMGVIAPTYAPVGTGSNASGDKPCPNPTSTAK
jgi:hypothetical protein